MYRHLIKRLLDIFLSLAALAVLSPLLLLTAALIRATMGAPVFFRQERAGKNGRVFTMLKFRTMPTGSDRPTALGRLLRCSGVDELPELLNVIRGDMSLIGPRPLPPEYTPLFTAEERRRLEVRGGLIPPEVAFGDVTPSWSSQLKCEAEYARNVTFKWDARIALFAVRAMAGRLKSGYGGYLRLPLDDERKGFSGRGGGGSK